MSPLQLFTHFVIPLPIYHFLKLMLLRSQRGEREDKLAASIFSSKASAEGRLAPVSVTFPHNFVRVAQLVNNL